MLYIEQYYTIYWQSITLWFIGGEQEGKVETKSERKRVEEEPTNFLASSRGIFWAAAETWHLDIELGKWRGAQMLPLFKFYFIYLMPAFGK